MRITGEIILRQEPEHQGPALALSYPEAFVYGNFENLQQSRALAS
jgi:hypothetical protein